MTNDSRVRKTVEREEDCGVNRDNIQLYTVDKVKLIYILYATNRQIHDIATQYIRDLWNSVGSHNIVIIYYYHLHTYSTRQVLSARYDTETMKICKFRVRSPLFNWRHPPLPKIQGPFLQQHNEAAADFDDGMSRLRIRKIKYRSIEIKLRIQTKLGCLIQVLYYT